MVLYHIVFIRNIIYFVFKCGNLALPHPKLVCGEEGEENEK
jgi:hypothetical protein